eukprot:1159951-Pelagomonas_calceolata.AAC.2
MACRWAEIMTCMQPKTYFLRPDIATQLGIAVVREFFAQKDALMVKQLKGEDVRELMQLTLP